MSEILAFVNPRLEDLKLRTISTVRFSKVRRDFGFEKGRNVKKDRTRGNKVMLTFDRDGRGKVLWLKAFEGTDYVQQASYVAWLHDLWRFKRIHADASNHAVVDALRSKGLPVDPVAFTAPSKAELYGRLKAALEAGCLVLPDHRPLLQELSTFEYRISERGNLLLHHAVGGRDDYPDSLALAARDLTARKGTPGPVPMPLPNAPVAMGPEACRMCGREIEAGQPFTMSSEGTRHAGDCPEG